MNRHATADEDPFRDPDDLRLFRARVRWRQLRVLSRAWRLPRRRRDDDAPGRMAAFAIAGQRLRAAGAVGNGIVSRGVLSTSIGTSGVMFVHSDEVKIDPAGRVHTFCHAVHGKWHLMGVNLAAGGSLQWFQNELCQTGGQNGKAATSDDYEALNQEAAAVAAGSEGLFFLPYLSGERTPHADPDARGCFIGLSLTHGRGHMLRSIGGAALMGVGGAMAYGCSIGQGLTGLSTLALASFAAIAGILLGTAAGLRGLLRVQPLVSA